VSEIMEENNNNNTDVDIEETSENESAEETVEEAAEENPGINEADDLRSRLAEQEDKYYRLAAEYANYKTRTQKEKDARYADAVIDTAAAFLPIVDNLERAVQVEANSEDAKKILEGVGMVLKQVNDSFAKIKIKPIEALGNEFDPNLHNAVIHIEDDNLGENIVAEELMKGYIYNDDRVVRHSMVKVAN